MTINEILDLALAQAATASDDYLNRWLELHPDNAFGEPAMCGFAWVQISGRHPIAREAKKRGIGGKHWKTGYMFWNPSDYRGQSVDVKEAGAAAFARVLMDNGIAADVGSRLD